MACRPNTRARRSIHLSDDAGSDSKVESCLAGIPSSPQQNCKFEETDLPSSDQEESGWTQYFEQPKSKTFDPKTDGRQRGTPKNSLGISHAHHVSGQLGEYDEDSSMASDASSGPEHQLVVSDETAERIQQKRRKVDDDVREQVQQQISAGEGACSKLCRESQSSILPGMPDHEPKGVKRTKPETGATRHVNESRNDK